MGTGGTPFPRDMGPGIRRCLKAWGVPINSFLETPHGNRLRITEATGSAGGQEYTFPVNPSLNPIRRSSPENGRIIPDSNTNLPTAQAHQAHSLTLENNSYPNPTRGPSTLSPNHISIEPPITAPSVSHELGFAHLFNDAQRSSRSVSSFPEVTTLHTAPSVAILPQNSWSNGSSGNPHVIVRDPSLDSYIHKNPQESRMHEIFDPDHNGSTFQVVGGSDMYDLTRRGDIPGNGFHGLSQQNSWAGSGIHELRSVQATTFYASTGPPNTCYPSMGNLEMLAAHPNIAPSLASQSPRSFDEPFPASGTHIRGTIHRYSAGDKGVPLTSKARRGRRPRSGKHLHLGDTHKRAIVSKYSAPVDKGNFQSVGPSSWSGSTGRKSSIAEYSLDATLPQGLDFSPIFPLPPTDYNSNQDIGVYFQERLVQGTGDDFELPNFFSAAPGNQDFDSRQDDIS